MSLMQITEPNKKSKHVDDHTAIGIDFGTTNCVCTFLKMVSTILLLTNTKN